MGTVHVVGAGLAGLSAAVALAETGARVLLPEAAQQPGGRLRSSHDPAPAPTIMRRSPPRRWRLCPSHEPKPAPSCV